MAAYPVRQQAGPVEPSWVEQLLGLLAVPYQWAGRELGGEYEAMAGWTAPFAAIANAPRFLGNALGQAGQSLQEAGEGAPLVTQENVSPIPGPWNYRINQRGADVVGAGLDVAGSGLLARGVRHVPDLAQGLLRHVDDLAANPAAVSRIFGGMGAKTADTDALARAFAMEEAGEGREAIRQATGWFRAPWDKKWRFEIDDSAALVNPSGEGLARVSNDIPYAMDIDYGPGGLMEHPRFAAAYDQPFLIPHTRVKPSNTMLGSNRGAFDPNSGELTYFAPQAADSARSTGLHEMQHAVQNSENFARGGNPKDMDVGSLKRDAVASLRDEINRLYTVGGKEQIEKADRLGRTLNYILNGIENDQVKMYRRLAGEAEARLVQQRRNLTPQQRGLLDPIEQMDTMLKQEGIRGGIDDLIVRYGDGPAMSAPIPDELPFGLPERIQAFRTARTNAALPVEQGGLGLGPANTAAERARAMKVTAPAFHGTTEDVDAFIGEAWGSQTPSLASQYAEQKGAQRAGVGEYARRFSESPMGVVYPLKIRKGKTLTVPIGTDEKITQEGLRKATGVDFPTLKYTYETDEFTGEPLNELAWRLLNSGEFKDAARASGIDSLVVRERGHPTTLSLNPANIRSRFAAF
nr:hypothetical protein [Thiobacillaceae bacterium]